MPSLLQRVSTTYLPVANPTKSSDWYQRVLGAEESFADENKATIHLANQRFSLVRAKLEERANFLDYRGKERFSLSFEVNNEEELVTLRNNLSKKRVPVGEIKHLSTSECTFVFYDLDGNAFNVRSQT
ncbi:VOC family protein [Paenalkalicoccus suaedae]|uniref:VOC family protein n=1 Tax=Paenalkalicoccus suaedae TaxID=2592382 RepID=A0A859F9V0_9BACI|nr:VOC family protein [Paenalkalicoccus suaedae]QKS69973.1 VOC family protein [Paenalkalicoccus suaedae]